MVDQFFYCDKELQTKSIDDPRPDWIDYPNGLRLASLPYRGKNPCPGCQAVFDQRHRHDCPEAMCPKCRGHLATCDCTDPLLATKIYYSKTQIRRKINQLASEYLQDRATVEIGSDRAEVLAAKVAQFENMVALARAGKLILSGFTQRQLDQMQPGSRPRIVDQAQVMIIQANKIWLDWFYK